MLPGENYSIIAQSVAEKAAATGRDAADVRLIAVSKTVDADAVKRAMEQGARDFGENRPDCLMDKTSKVSGATWHFIGNIQSRRIPDIVAHADIIHSLFQERHGLKIDAAAHAIGKVQDVLVEVNVSGEESKSGCAPEEAGDLVVALSKLDNVRVIGLMTMAPAGDDSAARNAFAGLRTLREKICTLLDPESAEAFRHLSMGMSGDWRIAVEEGATMVRIGRAIFNDGFAG